MERITGQLLRALRPKNPMRGTPARLSWSCRRSLEAEGAALALGPCAFSKALRCQASLLPGWEVGGEVPGWVLDSDLRCHMSLLPLLLLLGLAMLLTVEEEGEAVLASSW